MKPHKNRKATPEESLRASCEESLGPDLDYTRVREKLDVEAIARAGAARRAKSTTAAPVQESPPSRRTAIAAVLLVTALILATPILGIGGYLIANRSDDPTPPDETVEHASGVTDSHISGRPADSDLPALITPTPIDPNGTGGDLSNLFDLSESYATDNAAFLRAEHLDPRLAEGTLPAVLKISDSKAWRQLFSQEPVSDNPALQDFFTEISADYLWETPLLVVVTEGRSGSIRYRLDEAYATSGKMTLELVAEVPPALTMDIVHWCVVIPVDKDEADLPVELALRDEPGGYDVDGPVIIPDILTPDPDKLWFSSSSYARNGCLYGRLWYESDLVSPRAVTTFDEWQTLYQGCSSDLDKDFIAGVMALDEAFFAEQSLLIVYQKEGSGSYRHRVDEVVVKDGTLHVTLTTLCPEIGTDDMAYWAILIPIDKESATLPVEIEEVVEWSSPAS